MIFTFCYAKGADDEQVIKTSKAVEENGGEICFVFLTAEKREIEKRLLAESRLNYSKLKDLAILRNIRDKDELFSPVPGRESLIIDNTELSAEKTAEQIIPHFDLQ